MMSSRVICRCVMTDLYCLSSILCIVHVVLAVVTVATFSTELAIGKTITITETTYQRTQCFVVLNMNKSTVVLKLHLV